LAEEISALHTGTTGLTAHQERHIGVGEGDLSVAATRDALHELKGAVLKLHLDTLKSVEALGDFEELKDHGLIGAKDLTCSDGEEEAVADVACSACDGDAKGALGRHN
jgi:hypothetical protein